jgi:hypothetical protein
LKSELFDIGSRELGRFVVVKCTAIFPERLRDSTLFNASR